MKKHLPLIFNVQRLKPGCVAVLFCLGLPVSALAQSDTTKKIKEVHINSVPIPVLPVIVPSQSVSSNEFIHYNALTVADAIRDFSGVTIKDYGGIGGLKTIFVRGLGANHTSVLFDGIQMNDAENGQVDLGRLNLTNISSVTLYNGQPPVILQTARAFAAASILSIETIKPNLTVNKPYQITAGIKTGSFGLANPYLVWQQRISDKWAFAVNTYTENADGQYKYLTSDGTNTIKQTRIGSGIAAQQVDGSLYFSDADSKLDLRVNYFNSDRGIPKAVVLYTPPATGQKLYNRDLFFQGNYIHKWESGLQLLISSKFSQNQLHYFDPQFPSTSGFLDQHYGQREYYQSAALSYYIRPNWEVSYASDFALNNMTADLANFRYPTRITLLNVLASNLILGDLTLQGSILNTNFNETVRYGAAAPHRNKFSPTIIGILKPFDDKSFSLRAFYKSIFRLPTFLEQYYGFVSNPNLKPESVDQYDLGFAYTKSLSGIIDYVAFTADGYYNHVSNKIVYIPTLTLGPSQNYGKVDIEGLDIGVKTQAKLAECRLSLSANYSYQNAENISDPTQSTYLNQLPYIPKNTVAVNAGLSRGAVGVYFNQVLLSTRYYTNNNIPDDALPAYAVSDASAIYHGSLYRFPISLSAEVNNLFDKSYVVVRSYPMPGRSYRFSFQITI